MDLITFTAAAAAAQTAAAASGDEAAGVAERTDEHYANTVLLLHGDGNPGANNVNNPAPEAQYMALSDDSPNDRQVIRFGTNVYGTDFNPFYYNAGVFSNSFNGDNPDYLEVPNSVIDVGYEPITIECFLYIAGTDAFQPVWGISNGGGGSPKINLHDVGDGALTIENTVGGGNFSTATSVRASINKKWVHVAFVRENPSTNGAKIYIDGVLEATGTVSGNLTSWSGNLRIGRNPENYSTALDGFISNFRITHSAVYTSAFTAPTVPFEDPTTHGELSVSSDASGDYLQLTNTDFSKYDFGTGPFTVEFWIYYDTLGTTILGQTGWGNVFQRNSSSNVFQFYQAASAGNSGAYWITGTTTLVTGQWYHVVFQRDDAGVLDLWVNGSRDATTSSYASTDMTFHSGKGDICLRYWYGGASSAVDKISNLRIQRGAVYATGTSITVPTTPFTPDANTVLLTCQGKTFQDHSTNNQAIARSGDAHISEFGPFGDGYWSNYFDNVGDYITIPDDNSLRLGTEAFTIEAWIYPTWSSPDANEPIVGSGTTGAGTFYLSIQSTSVVRFNHGSAAINSTGTISPNQWTHIAVVREGTGTNQTKIYINGVNDGTGTASSDLNSTSGLRIGRNRGGTARYWQGYLSNVRIVKGTALYTSTFTPSTTPLTAVTNTVLLTCQSNRFIDNSAESHSLTVYANSKISEFIPFEYLRRQTKLITCQENRFKDIIDYRHSVTPTGKTKVSTVSPFSSNASYKTANTGAMYLNGSSFAMVDDQGESFKFGTEDYTMEAWVYDSSTDTAQRTIFGRNGTGNLAIPYVYKLPSSEVFGLYYSGLIASTTRKIYKGEWTHLALCRENGTSRLFINGELQGSGSDTTNIVTPAKLVIGNNGGSSSNLGWNGYIYGVRVEKGRARYTSNASFKPASTQPSLANSANTGAISTNQFSNFFDGNDHLANTSVLPLNDFKFGNNNDWTIEGWINSNDVSGRQILDWRPGTSQNKNCPNIGLNGSSKIELYINTGTAISSRALSVGKWYHFAFVRFGNSTKLYLDGLQEGATYADTVDYVADRLTIGASVYSGATAQYYGWLHGLNVLNGVAKYTSNTAVTYSPVSKVGTANTNGSFSRYIPGLNTKIAIPTTGLPTGSAHRTIECWLKVTAFGSESTQYMVAYGQNSAGKVYSIGLTSGGALRVVSYGTDYSTSVVVPLNTWFHISVGYDGTYNTIFLNGIMVDRRSFSFNTGTHTHLYVNAEANGYAGQYVHRQGIQICDLAVYNVAIRSAVTTSGFIPPTSATTIASNNNIVLLGCQSNTDIELASGELKGGYDQSAISSETPFDNGYWSVHFDGNGDYLTLPTTTDHDFGTGDFTVEFWILTKESLGFHIFLSAPQSTTTQLGYDTGNGPRYLYFYNGSNIITGTGADSLITSAWNHVALAREGTTLSLFSNGNRVGTATHSSSVSFSNLNIGRYNAGGYDMISSISNLRMVKGSALYSPSSTTYTVPTSPLTTTSQGATASEVKLLTCQSGAFLDNSAANSGIGYTISVYGDSRVSRSRPFSTELSRDQVLLACQDKEVQKDNSHLDTKFTRTGDVTRSADNPFDDGFWSGQFDGSGDKITSPENVIDLDTSSFTAELWFKQKGNGSNGDGIGNTLLIIGASSSSNAIWITISNAGVIQARIRYNGSSWETTLTGPTIQSSTWHHVALVKNTSDSDSIKFFVDGILVASGTNSTDLTSFGEKVGIGGQIGANRNFNGLISNVRVVVGSALYTTTFTPSTSPFTTTSQSATASEVKLLTCQSSNFVDNSGSEIKLEEAGNANTRPVFPDTFADTIPQQTTFLAGKYRGSVRNIGFLDESSNNTTIVYTNQATQGSFTPHYPPEKYWSNFFDGSGDGLTTATSSDFAFGTGDFTFECFAFPTTDTSSGVKVLLDLRDANNNDADHMSAIVWTGSAMDCYSAGNFSSGTDLSFPQGKWTHLCVQRISNVLYFSTNGTVSSTTPAFTRNLTANGKASIGGNVGLGVSMFTGFISNLRIIKGTGIYGTSSFTSPTGPLTKTSQGATASEVKLLTCQGNRFIDNSDSEHSLTVSGNSKVKPFFPFDLTTSYDPYDHGGSVHLDGSGDYLTTDDVLGFDFSGEFTVECWFYQAAAVNWGVLFCASVSDRFQIAITNSNTIDLRFNGGQVGTPFSVYQNEWNHIAVTRDSSNVIRQFLNGVLKNTNTNTSSLDNGYMRIGCNQLGANPFNGHIASARIVNGSALYTSAFTPSTSPFTTSSQSADPKEVKLLLNFTNAGIYDSTAKNNFLIYGDAQISTGAANTKFGTGSIFFDQGESVRATGSGIPIGRAPFTIEMFAKINNTAHNPSLLRIAGGSFVMQYYGGEFEIGNEPTPVIQVPYTIIPDRWYHIAVTRDDSNNLRLFVDGKHLKTATNYTTNFSDADYFLGNLYSTGGVSRTLKGFLDEVRITVGQARYTTANFTPMTAASGNRSPDPE